MVKVVDGRRLSVAGTTLTNEIYSTGRPTQSFQATGPKLSECNDFQVRNFFFSDNEKKLVYIRVLECGESKYGLCFFMGPLLPHIFGCFCSKEAKMRQKQRTTSLNMSLPATHEGFIQEINPWLCRKTNSVPGEPKAKCIAKYQNSQTGLNLDPKAWASPELDKGCSKQDGEAFSAKIE